jgi:hypothetical protein
MKTEQELKSRCTPEFIKWMCLLAGGFEYIPKGSEDINLHYIKAPDGFKSYFGIIKDHEYTLAFSTLIHRAVEGWNKTSGADSIGFYGDRVESCIDFNSKEYMFNYQPQSLTQSECAALDCLLDIYEVEKK